MFPKTRSWLALGAPLELLSPLSLVRVTYALALVLWAVEGVAFSWSAPGGASLLVALAVTGVTWLRLFRVAKLSSRGCGALLAGAVVLDLIVVGVSPSTGVAVASATLLFPLAVVVAFFHRARAVAALQLLITGGLWVETSVRMGVAVGATLTVGWSLAMLSVSLVVQVLMKSIGRSGTVDPETGLPNGAGFARRFDAARRSAGTDEVLVVAAVLLAGVDDARQALGYRVGADLLRRAVEDLGQVVPPNTLIARVEGDELVITQSVPHQPRPPDHPHDARVVSEVQAAARALANELVAAIYSGRYMIDRVEVSLRAHIGLAFAFDQNADAAELVRQATLSARKAHTAGIGSAVFDGETGALTADDLALLGDLRLAVDRGELRLAYQPQLEVASGKICGVEALLRWDAPARGMVPPGRFIVLAERTGLIERLTHWVVIEALDAQARWRARGIECPVSVNLSPRTLGLPDLAESILHELEARGLPPSALTVEVTETAAADLLQAVQLLRPLHEHGVRVSIDDFGTGYTSLAAIPYLPLDEIKVDMGFVKRSLQSPADQAIVRSVRELTHRLGLTSVAEGVEDGPIQELMVDIGFDLLQGYNIAKPVFETELLQLLTDWEASRRAGHRSPPPMLSGARL